MNSEGIEKGRTMHKNWSMTENNSVKVTDSYYEEALLITVGNILKLDADRLLAGFRETAGIIKGLDTEKLVTFMRNKARYSGGWEDGMIGGHTLGHYITAMSQAAVNSGLSETQREKVRNRLDYTVDSLLECQEMTIGTPYDGYLFGAALPSKQFRDNPTLQFDHVEEGKSDPFTQAWVPWYTMHKILSGLNAAYNIAGNRNALKVANRLALWIANRVNSWSSETQKTVLSIEYGGMNECLYELYRINQALQGAESSFSISDPVILYNAAHRFDEEDLFERALSGEKDLLKDVHANTTIPKFIGALARYEADNNETRYLDYAKAFWDMVIEKHSYVTGGNSEDEHFGADSILDAERTNVNNETCNTYNMLKFSRRLFCATSEKKYLDYSERTLINAILASQDHETGFTTYFQPMATGYHKVFNTLEGNFWCCTGTGYENFTKLQQGIYYRQKGRLLVALYIASQLETEDYQLKQECDLTRSDLITFRFTAKNGSCISDDLYLRKPSWVSEDPVIKIDGKACDIREKDGFYILNNSFFKNQNTITVRLPMRLHYENLPDGKDTYAFLYGPFVLSAKLGTANISTKTHGIAVLKSGSKAVESDVITITEEKTVSDFLRNLDKYLIRKPETMDFKLSGVSTPLLFTTHYNQYTESYGIYWRLSEK